MISLARYLRFLTIGGIVGVLTLGCRQVVAYFVGDDSTLGYSFSVSLAYGLGILISFALNRRITFATPGSPQRGGWRRLILFVLVSLLGLAATWFFSLAIRYGFDLDGHIGRFGPVIAFIAAALLSSALTFPIHRLLVFRDASAEAEPQRSASSPY